MRSDRVGEQSGQTVLEYCIVSAVLLFATILFFHDIGTRVRTGLERGFMRTIQLMIPTHG